MSYKHPLTTDGVSKNDPDWSSLAGQVVDDISRILHSEADLLQVRMGEAVNAGISKSLRAFSMLALAIWGAGCILLGTILLLHEWIPLWQALGVVGLLTMGIGGVGSGMIRRRQ
jgi:Putative Actinobacterial Holin-X, holin superfamily III